MHGCQQLRGQPAVVKDSADAVLSGTLHLPEPPLPLCHPRGKAHAHLGLGNEFCVLHLERILAGGASAGEGVGRGREGGVSVVGGGVKGS